MTSRLIRPLAIMVSVGCLSMGSALRAQDDDARLDNLLQRIEQLEHDTTLVEDITQIQRIQRALGFYLDKGYFGEAASMFSDDGRVMMGMDGVYIGRDRIQELFTRHGGGSVSAGPGLPFGRINMHMQLSPTVTVAADGQSASARWMQWSLTGNYEQAIQWGDATLENSYVKEDGVWKISEMNIFTNFIAPYEGGWAALAPTEGEWKTSVAEVFPADEPSPVSYKPFPVTYAPPFHFANDHSSIMSDPPLAAVQRDDDAIGRLESQADEHAAKLARQRSLRAIENLQAMYGYYIEEGRWQEAAGLFTDNGIWEFGQSGQYIGTASIVRGLSRMGPEGLEDGLLNHYPMLQPVIHVSEDNSRAWGRWRSDVMWSRDGKGQWGGGLYENGYVNDNGTWKISKNQYWVTFWGDYDQGMTTAGYDPLLPAAGLEPDAPPSAVYESFPNTYIVPFHYDNPVTGRPHDDLARAAEAQGGQN